MGAKTARAPLKPVYTLDTNAIIYYLKGEESVVSHLDEIFARPAAVYITTITELELFSFSDLSGKELVDIEEFLTIVSIIALDSRIARIGASLRQAHHLETADAVIAATAAYTGTTLVTRNVRDFTNIPDLALLAI